MELRRGPRPQSLITLLTWAFISCLAFLASLALVSGAGLNAVNRCAYVVWPVFQRSGDAEVSNAAGVVGLKPNGSVSWRVPDVWSGSIWGRTGCIYNSSGGIKRCETGSGQSGVTLAEITFGANNLTYYNVSILSGFNLPLSLSPSPQLRCSEASCLADINRLKHSGNATLEKLCPNSFVSGGPARTFACSRTEFTVSFCSNYSLKINGTIPPTQGPSSIQPSPAPVSVIAERIVGGKYRSQSLTVQHKTSETNLTVSIIPSASPRQLPSPRPGTTCRRWAGGVTSCARNVNVSLPPNPGSPVFLSPSPEPPPAARLPLSPSASTQGPSPLSPGPGSQLGPPPSSPARPVNVSLPASPGSPVFLSPSPEPPPAAPLPLSPSASTQGPSPLSPGPGSQLGPPPSSPASKSAAPVTLGPPGPGSQIGPISGGRSKSAVPLVVGVCSGVIGIVGVVIGYLVWMRRSRQKHGKSKIPGIAPWKFKYKELYLATKGFSPTELLGEGGQGQVYKGILVGSGLPVAVKRVPSARGARGIQDLVSEMHIISTLRHRNLVQFQGWCENKGELLVVYDYMPNGSLDKALFAADDFVLDWHTRYKIVCGLCKALLYLHDEGEKRVVHRDIKPSNIMLDANFEAKLGDFGLARLVDHDVTPRTTAVAGTMGYVAPELARTRRPTAESDVFSFGIVALEVACGRQSFLLASESGSFLLLDKVRNLAKQGRLMEAADPRLAGSFDVDEMESLLSVGLAATKSDPDERPTMKQIITILTREAPASFNIEEEE